jgi:biotin-(acetyl-CoA carboxylase) ligase
MLGDQVTIEQMGARLDGRYVGVDDDGALLLKPDGGPVQRIVAGDLVRGPSPSRE